MSINKELVRHASKILHDDRRIQQAADAYSRYMNKLDPTKDYSEIFENDEALELKYYERVHQFYVNLLSLTIAEMTDVTIGA